MTEHEEDSMIQNTDKTNLGFLNLQAFSIGILIGYMSIAGVATAAPLPKGNCADPKPYTDLTQCRFKKTDLKDKDLQGADLRGVSFYQRQLQGTNLTNAQFDGQEITNAILDGAIGLPTEALAILKTSYLATPNTTNGFDISVLPSGSKVSYESIAGLDNIFMTQKVAETHSTLALLSHPKYGEAPTSAIFARFDNDKFEFPACYKSVNLMNDRKGYIGPRWVSMKVRLLNKGGYLIGVLAKGAYGDDEESSAWEKVAIVELSSTCKLTVLHQEYALRTANGRMNSMWCGNSLTNYRFVDDQTAEIEITTPPSSKKACGGNASPQERVVSKTIKLNSQH
jgi:hypothetical protein